MEWSLFLNGYKNYVMKKSLGLFVLIFATVGMFSACEPPEQRAADTNAMNQANMDSESGARPMPYDSMNEMHTDEGVKNEQAAPANAAPVTADVAAATPKKGKVTVSMAAIDNSKDQMEMDKNGVYARAEIMPSFPGGEKELAKYVENNLQYPQAALDNNTEGRVLLEFDVDERGKIYNPIVVSPKFGNGLEEEALRIIKGMPQWTPGQMKGKNVKTKFTLPISYQLL